MGAGVEAGSADAGGKAIDDGHLFAEIGGLGGAFLSSRACANYDEVIFIRSGHTDSLNWINMIIYKGIITSQPFSMGRAR